MYVNKDNNGDVNMLWDRIKTDDGYVYILKHIRYAMYSFTWYSK